MLGAPQIRFYTLYEFYMYNMPYIPCVIDTNPSNSTNALLIDFTSEPFICHGTCSSNKINKINPNNLDKH